MKAGLASVALSILVLSPALANGNCDGNCDDQGSRYRAAPAPTAGAGLTGLGIALGLGAYWLVRRRRNNAG